MKVPEAKLLAPKSVNFSQLYAKKEQKDKMENILCHSDLKDVIKLTKKNQIGLGAETLTWVSHIPACLLNILRIQSLDFLSSLSELTCNKQI